ncbi:unnamed protein product [Closterium sp. Naga37s-1]|nr:unnamed protein product [Closterium sp. Naga37s-1]
MARPVKQQIAAPFVPPHRSPIAKSVTAVVTDATVAAGMTALVDPLFRAVALALVDPVHYPLLQSATRAIFAAAARRPTGSSRAPPVPPVLPVSCPCSARDPARDSARDSARTAARDCARDYTRVLPVLPRACPVPVPVLSARVPCASARALPVLFVPVRAPPVPPVLPCAPVLPPCSRAAPVFPCCPRVAPVLPCCPRAPVLPRSARVASFSPCPAPFCPCWPVLPVLPRSARLCPTRAVRTR